ncbi:MAG: NAD(+)/NADH kinase [Spirochaetota bacterium]
MRATSIVILVNSGKREHEKVVASLIAVAARSHVKARICALDIAHARKTPSAKGVSGAKLLITVGGDGTLLAGIRMAAPYRVPVMPVYYGTLGFMAENTVDESMEMLHDLLTGRKKNYIIETRHMLDVSVRSKRHNRKMMAVNEAVVAKGHYPKLARFSVSIGGRGIAPIKADGIIVASPTGSTAYALSAGGPIVNPRVDALVLVPIAPHALTFRPLVIAGDDTVSISLASGAPDTVISVDGLPGEHFRTGDTVTISRSRTSFMLVKQKRLSFYQILTDKLNWGR